MRKILVIDDDEQVRELIADYFREVTHYDVISAATGRAGLKLAKKQSPDVILLDIRMPGLDGFDVLKKLNAKQATAYIPVIMLTGVDTREAKMKASEEYADDYIVKPLDMDLLQEKVERILSILHKK